MRKAFDRHKLPDHAIDNAGKGGGPPKYELTAVIRSVVVDSPVGELCIADNLPLQRIETIHNFFSPANDTSHGSTKCLNIAYTSHCRGLALLI